MSPAITTVLFLVIANVFMTFAWYGHLKLSSTGVSTNWPLFAIILLSWGIALVEYCFQVPANRMGYQGNGGPYSLIQLKVMQVEMVFQWPGLGRLAIEAITYRDFQLVQGVVVWIALMYMVINLVVDMSYNHLDPRLRKVR